MSAATAESSNAHGIDANPNAQVDVNRLSGGKPDEQDLANIAGSDDMAMPAAEEGEDRSPSSSSPPSGAHNRRMSREWDASKVPPSQFQKRKGSIYSTRTSRDGHVQNSSSRDKAYHDKLKEKGWK